MTDSISGIVMGVSWNLALDCPVTWEQKMLENFDRRFTRVPINTVNPLYTGIWYNDKIRYNDNLKGTIS